jgi:hypothetical protein
MQIPEASRLAQTITQKVEDFKSLCEELDEETASRAPSGRWSPKEIVSHLCGPEGAGNVPTIRAFIEEDIPRLDIEAEDPFFSEKRAHMTFAELLDEFDKEYNRVSELVAGLSDEQLTRKAQIPMLKESPFGEYPTLSEWIQVIGEYHLGSHVKHMREILETLEVTSGQRRRSIMREAQESTTFVV